METAFDKATADWQAGTSKLSEQLSSKPDASWMADFEAQVRGEMAKLRESGESTVQVRFHIICNAHIEMYVNFSHAWFLGTDITIIRHLYCTERGAGQAPTTTARQIGVFGAVVRRWICRLCNMPSL